ncbi:MAG: hypothetical protein Q8Q89_01210 [bacterium]|nr:hypothetical protein [bacterium]
MPVIRIDYDNQKVSELQKWKKENNFQHLINMPFIPMKWKIEIGI